MVVSEVPALTGRHEAVVREIPGPAPTVLKRAPLLFLCDLGIVLNSLFWD